MGEIHPHRRGGCAYEINTVLFASTCPTANRRNVRDPRSWAVFLFIRSFREIEVSEGRRRDRVAPGSTAAFLRYLRFSSHASTRAFDFELWCGFAALPSSAFPGQSAARRRAVSC